MFYPISSIKLPEIPLLPPSSFLPLPPPSPPSPSLLPHSSSTALNTGLVLWFQQFYAILLKRFYNTIRLDIGLKEGYIIVHQGQVTYHLPAVGLSLPAVFKAMESNKERLIVALARPLWSRWVCVQYYTLEDT